jgi:hypothetical protein
MLSDYDVDLAERVGHLLQKQQPKSGRAGVPPASVPVRDWFLSLDLEEFDAMFLPVTSSDRYLRQLAVKMIAEVRAARWVRDENFKRGVAPSSADAAHMYTRAMQDMGEGSIAEDLSRSADSVTKNGRRTLRKWAGRVRTRWGIASTQLATLDAPPRASLGSKAGLVPKSRFAGILLLLALDS